MNELALPKAPSRGKTLRRLASRNKVACAAACILLVIVVLSLLAPWLHLPDPVAMDPSEVEEQGSTAMPLCRKLPEAMLDPTSLCGWMIRLLV